MATNHQSQSRISWSKKYPRNPVDWLEKMLKSNRWFQESQFLLPSMSLKPDENEHVQSKVPRHETSQRTGKRWPVEERSADVVRKAISTILKNTCRTKATGKIVGNTAGSHFIPTLFIFLSQISNILFFSLHPLLPKKEQCKEEKHHQKITCKTKATRWIFLLHGDLLINQLVKKSERKIYQHHQK
jgi:hypothetical protein